MKSEKAKELIEKYAVGNSRDAAPSMMKGRAVECVELAEQEAEERMRAKAIEEHRKRCFFRDFHNDECANTATKCGEHSCFYMNEFIQKLHDE